MKAGFRLIGQEQPSGAKRLVLLIEDNDDHALLIEEALSSAVPDSAIVHLATGRAAMSWVRSPDKSVPSAIFLDLKLPEVSGVEVLQTIRANTQLNEVPVYILTTSHSLDEIRQCRAIGADAYLTKDIGLALLAEYGLNLSGKWPSQFVEFNAAREQASKPAHFGR